MTQRWAILATVGMGVLLAGAIAIAWSLWRYLLWHVQEEKRLRRFIEEHISR